MRQAEEHWQLPLRAAFLLPNLALGGTERVTLDLARGFVGRGANVDLVLMERSGEFLAALPNGIAVVDLKAPRLRHAIRPLRQYLKASKPDVLIAAMWPLTTVAIMAAAGLSARPRVVVADHAPLVAQYAESARASLFLKASIRASYRFADRIVAVCDGLADELAMLAGLPRSRVTTIYNPIPRPSLSEKPGKHWPDRPVKRVIAAGRLKPVKNYPLLVEAFAPLARAGDGAVLAILGDGAERSAIEAVAARLGISDRVLLPGYTPDMGDWLQDADLLVSASDYEGFGNVLVEAMHFGLPVISTDCPYAPREVLGEGRWGALVPLGDVAALTAAMRAALGAATTDRAQQIARANAFSVDRAVDLYWQAALR